MPATTAFCGTARFFLARRSGLLLAVYPEHDPTTQLELEARVWSSFLAPVTAFRLVGAAEPLWLATVYAGKCLLWTVSCRNWTE